MKKNVLSIAAAILVAAGFADETLYQKQTFKKSDWQEDKSGAKAAVDNGSLVLEAGKRYVCLIRGEQPFGGKFRFNAENLSDGKFRLGVRLRGGQRKLLLSEELQNRGEFTVELPRRATALDLVIQGEGKYRNFKFTRILKPGYRIEVTPAYQMVSGTPEPLKFTLYHDGRPVPDAELKIQGPDAVHPESGATAGAYIDRRKSVTEYEQTAAQIKLDAPVRILYLGDSLTHFDYGHNHVDKVRYFLNRAHPGKAEIWNYAVRGDFIERVLLRLDGKAPGRWRNYYHDLWSRSYDWAFVFLGHNDTRAYAKDNYRTPLIPPDRQKKYYEDLIARLKAKGIRRIILMSSASSNYELCSSNAAKSPKSGRYGEPAHLEKFNEILQELAKEHALEYLDVYTPMKNHPHNAALLNRFDGIHLSDAGHDFIALETLKYLRDHPEGKSPDHARNK